MSKNIIKGQWDSSNVRVVEKDDLAYIQFENFKKYDHIISHCFTTRLGGFSENECSSLNLGFNRNDARENVQKNYEKISGAIGVDYRNMVFSNQVHDNKIRIVEEGDRGKGIVFESDIKGYDGLMTDKKDVVLVTFYADCVPVFFLDPVKKVIALSHSGWRGTVKEISRETIRMMVDKFNSSVEDIETAIGPSIGSCCFEVGEEVYMEFKDKLDWSDKFCKKALNEKWYINLQGIIKRTLINSGIKEEKICMSGICTKCNNHVFFSHRGDLGKTGSLAAIMSIK